MLIGSVKLRSPSLPLLLPRETLALAALCADASPDRLPSANVLSAGVHATVLWSAAEAVADIYQEKTLFDAFKPVNATITGVIAVVTALSTEAIRTGVLNVPSEDEEDEPDAEPINWAWVAQGTGLGFVRDSTAVTLQRATEKLAKPRVSAATHREMIKHLPKMARKNYAVVAADSGSKWRAASSTALAVARSPVFFVMRSACALLADVGVDVMRVVYGTLSESAFKQNAVGKLIKHSASCACCLAAGCVLPMTLGVPSHLLFIVSDLVGSTAADQLLVLLGRSMV